MSDFKKLTSYEPCGVEYVSVSGTSYIEQLKAENAALRELCRRFSEYISQDRCEGCVYKMRCNNGYMDKCWQLGEIRDLASELGIEVDA